MGGRKAAGGRSRPGTIRAFIALDVPAGLKAALGSVQGAFRNSRDRVSWTRAAGMHITLKFLGETDEALIPAVGQCMRRACGAAEPFALQLTGIGVFPDVRRPRVLWVGVGEGAAALSALGLALDAQLAELGFSQEKRPYHGHVTLGRIKSLGDRQRFAARVTEHRALELGHMPADALHLIESRLHPAGAQYTTRLTVPIGPGPVSKVSTPPQP